jgi:cytochrome P450
MAISNALLSPLLSYPILTTLLLPLFWLVVRTLYRVSPFHPLSKIPGPLLPRTTSLWLTYHAWIGDEASVVDALHKTHGSIVCTGPNSVDIADGAALSPIYVEKGGFAKPQFYENFALPDGDKLHNSIFSEIDPAVRAPRAKAVVVLFSTANLRAGQDLIYACVDKLVQRLKEGKELSRRSGKPLNVLNLTRGLAVDAVSLYLLGKSYDALVEQGAQTKEEKAAVRKELVGPMSASGMVDTFVAVGRFWYLPSSIFKLVEKFDAWWNADDKVEHSLSQVDDFVAGVVKDAEQAIAASQSGEKAIDHPLTSYPSRLLQAGFTASETRAQCKDLIFAGSDSTGMNLATIMFMLARHPECYEKVKAEVMERKPGFDDVQFLPYLRGVVKEGLRLSMANPSRLPRVVPFEGWTFKETYFPAGTEVSCTPYTLHLNPDIFPDPWSFRPERWLDPTDQMTRDAFPFGLGPRQCIARNLATVELYCAVARIVEADILQGAKVLKDRIEILEWFNSKVIGERIDLTWG